MSNETDADLHARIELLKSAHEDARSRAISGKDDAHLAMAGGYAEGLREALVILGVLEARPDDNYT